VGIAGIRGERIRSEVRNETITQARTTRMCALRWGQPKEKTIKARRDGWEGRWGNLYLEYGDIKQGLREGIENVSGR